MRDHPKPKVTIATLDATRAAQPDDCFGKAVFHSYLGVPSAFEVSCSCELSEMSEAESGNRSTVFSVYWVLNLSRFGILPEQLQDTWGPPECTEVAGFHGNHRSKCEQQAMGETVWV
jgi:hypothetical protein